MNALSKIAAGTAVAAATAYPVLGDVDFNKPLVVDTDNSSSYRDFDNFVVLNYVPGADHPFVVSFTENGSPAVALFDNDGCDTSGDVFIKNEVPLPSQVFAQLFKDGDDLSLSETVYDTASNAMADADDSLIGLIAIDVDAAKALLASTRSADETSADVEPRSVYIKTGTAMLKPGDQLSAYRRKIGYSRPVTVVKFRNRSDKSVYVKPDDGSDAYWAHNSNLSKVA